MAPLLSEAVSQATENPIVMDDEHDDATMTLFWILFLIIVPPVATSSRDECSAILVQKNIDPAFSSTLLQLFDNEGDSSSHDVLLRALSHRFRTNDCEEKVLEEPLQCLRVGRRRRRASPRAARATSRRDLRSGRRGTRSATSRRPNNREALAAGEERLWRGG